jgi:phosphonate transport system ATP-binding protein
MSLHNLDLARNFFQRLIGLRMGRIVFDQPASTIERSQWENLYQLNSPQRPPDVP